MSSAPQDLDLSQPSNLVAFLSDTPFACTQAEILIGGNANSVFRLHLCQPYDGNSTVVLKYGQRSSDASRLGLASSPLPFFRQEIETEVLRRVRKMLPEDALVNVPKVYHYDAQAHFIVMQDCGPSSRTLKQFLIDEPSGLHPEEAKHFGEALGIFVSTVQEEGTKDQDLMGLVAKNGEMRRIGVEYLYGNLMNSLEGEENSYLKISPEDLSTIKDLVKQASDSILNISSSFTIGDFWTGNAIVDTEPDTRKGREGHTRLKRVFIVDWEVSKPGIACLDVAQFATELHTARSFYPGKGGYSAVDDIIPAFFGTYAARKGALSIQDVRQMSMHIGTHMAVITPVVPSWKPKERVREFVVESLGYMSKGSRGDLEWLKSSGSILKDFIDDGCGA